MLGPGRATRLLSRWSSQNIDARGKTDAAREAFAVDLADAQARDKVAPSEKYVKDPLPVSKDSDT